MRRGSWGLLLVAGLSVPLSWKVTDRLESRNEFCVSCHLDDGIPLHAGKLREFEQDPPADLAAAHRREREEFRCIDCHGGTGLAGRVRVKLVSARDTLRYLAGRFREPDHMTHPLRDRDCSRCHASFKPQRSDTFHALAVHNVRLPHACVECHDGHGDAGLPGLNFLDRQLVLSICRNCHKEL